MSIVDNRIVTNYDASFDQERCDIEDTDSGSRTNNCKSLVLYGNSIFESYTYIMASRVIMSLMLTLLLGCTSILSIKAQEPEPECLTAFEVSMSLNIVLLIGDLCFRHTRSVEHITLDLCVT